jgi:hypothetical protein
MAKLSEEIEAYLRDPRLEQILALAGRDAPTPEGIGSDIDPQVANNMAFTQKGWIQHGNALRGLIEKHNGKKPVGEAPVTYNT